MGLKMQRKKKQWAIAMARILLEDAKTAATPEEAATNRANAARVVELYRHRDLAAMELYTEATTTSTVTTDVAPIEITVEAVETPTVEVAAAAAPTVEDVKTPAAAVAKKATAAATATKTTTKKTTWKKKK